MGSSVVMHERLMRSVIRVLFKSHVKIERKDPRSCEPDPTHRTVGAPGLS